MSSLTILSFNRTEALGWSTTIRFFFFFFLNWFVILDRSVLRTQVVSFFSVYARAERRKRKPSNKSGNFHTIIGLFVKMFLNE